MNQTSFLRSIFTLLLRLNPIRARRRSTVVSKPPSLRELAAGSRSRVIGFDLSPEKSHRLLEMGLTPGTTLQVVRLAPFGDPIEVKVRGYHLSLRKEEAAGILIESEPAS